MFSTIKKVYRLISKRHRYYLPLLVMAVGIFSLVETFSIGLLLPYIKIVSDPGSVHTNEYIREFYELLGSPTPSQFIVRSSVLLLAVYLFKLVYSVGFSYFQLKYVRVVYFSIVKKLFNNFLHQPYLKFIQANTAEYTQALVQESNNTTGLITAVITIITDGLTFLFLLLLMIKADVTMSLAICGLLGVALLVMSQTISRAIRTMGHEKIRLLTRVFRVIDEIFGNFKILKLNCRESFGEDQFNAANARCIKIQVTYGTLQVIPKYLVEFIGVVILIGVIIYAAVNQSLVAFVPKLVLFAISFSRILPCFNRIVMAYNDIGFNKKSVQMVSDFFDIKPVPDGDKAIGFSKSTQMANIGFAYKTGKTVLNDVSLAITKGSKIGFIGESGSGKSTLIDIFCGFIIPDQGRISVDGVLLNGETVRAWRSKIGYIPQNIYLFDGPVDENVCLGFAYDRDRVIKALKQARIYDFLSKNDGIKTRVGEGGVMLSGGQKQRIAIARALYNDPEILVLDEGTSALDHHTEEEIIGELMELAKGKTLIMIAHRHSTLANCDRIYKVEKGVLTDMTKVFRSSAVV